MTDTQKYPNELPIELALVRWSVVHLRWHEMSGSIPSLTAFLAGWCLRCIGASEPQEAGQLRDSFRAGWEEAGAQLAISSRAIDWPTTPANVPRFPVEEPA